MTSKQTQLTRIRSQLSPSHNHLISPFLFFIVTFLLTPFSLGAHSAFSRTPQFNKQTPQTIEQVKTHLTKLGFEQTFLFPYILPVLKVAPSSITLTSAIPQKTTSISPFHYNAISPESTPAEGVSGHLIFIRNGELSDLNHWEVQGSIAVMDIHSGKNWLNAASLGAKAAIFYDEGNTSRWVFQEKKEVTPIQFPMFRMDKSALEAFLNIGPLETITPETFQSDAVHPPLHVTIQSHAEWKRETAHNLYTLIPGKDPALSNDLVMVEAFLPTSTHAPHGEEMPDKSCSLSSLLNLAFQLKNNPPDRSVMLVVTTGHDNALVGWREMIWSLAVKSKILKKEKKALKNQLIELSDLTKCLEACHPESESETKELDYSYLDVSHLTDESESLIFQKAIANRLAFAVDDLSRQLMHLRLEKSSNNFQRNPALNLKKQFLNKEDSMNTEDQIKALAEKRLMLRQLEWKHEYTTLTPKEKRALNQIISFSLDDLHAREKDLKQQNRILKETVSFRNRIKKYDVKAVISLHLSSHGTGFGAFNKGWLYPLKSSINRTSAYRHIDAILKKHATQVNVKSNSENNVNNNPGRRKYTLYHDTLRPNRLTPWRSFFPDRPALGGEVSALAGLPGFTFATVHDARTTWDTPSDRWENMDHVYAARQSEEVCRLISALCNTPHFPEGDKIRNGFATVTGQCNRLLHGELFASKPAEKTVIMAFQGPGIYHAISGTTGRFFLKGVADKKHVLDKVIIEGYRFNESDGTVRWAIDKKQTGKPAYRLKMKRKAMATDLILFNASQTTLFDLMEPGNFHYMTKLNLYDGRRDALPLKYWYSRIDTRSSILTALFLEPGTPMKMTLSDSVLTKKLILTNGSQDHPSGSGYFTENWPAIHQTAFHTAKDMWHLITPRIETLESHGIFSERLAMLQQKGTALLNDAQSALKEELYDRFLGAATASWALASKVYDDVERNQKDVLLGVLFYIALFVPFAFCMERLLCGFTNIYKRITAFFIILLTQIAVIYNVHPAFQLAYSPVVIILAFFIIGLSLMVTAIIFFRFEREMTLIQRNATHMRQEEISSFKAFTAAFHLGVSNLKRRRMRTTLTCTTLVILTFTIMGFTTVKSIRQHTHTRITQTAPYHGFLMKQMNWRDFPREALGTIQSSFAQRAIVAPRVWLEGYSRSAAPIIPVRSGNFSSSTTRPLSSQPSSGHVLPNQESPPHPDTIYYAGGIAGFSPVEPQITGLDSILIQGRWFGNNDKNSVLIPRPMAKKLRVTLNDTLLIQGTPFQLVGIFDPEKLGAMTDLDGELLTPAIFPNEISEELTEVEMEAVEAGEDILSFQSRYSHISPDQTLIMPAKTLLAAGGRLKGFSGKPIEDSIESIDRPKGEKSKNGKSAPTPQSSVISNNSNNGHVRPPDTTKHETPRINEREVFHIYTHEWLLTTNIESCDQAMAVNSFQINTNEASSNSQMISLAGELADRFKLLIFMGTHTGTFVYNAAESIDYSGVPNIIIPLLISIFIVLNTMIAGVHERKREIGIYTSVGLAPTHVAFLFITEAMAFAVISVVLGYLAAQTSAALFAHTALWKGITVNYSSMAGVGAMLLVMAVVLISSIYPSKLAARIAIPDVNKTWKLPKPEGNRLILRLPFLLKHQEHLSIAGFLFDWFQSHQDYSHGIFSTGEVTICPPMNRRRSTEDRGESCTRPPSSSPVDTTYPSTFPTSPRSPKEKNGMGDQSVTPLPMLQSRVWLAPFDLGMMQQIFIAFDASGADEGYLCINVIIQRESGEADSWLRLNKLFLLELRKQLLVWRSLDDASKANFSARMTERTASCPI